ncbi:MAG TPA: carbohydrate ABC transporter permease [Chloroflexota bacterium]|nr:carbohydrate ABC transporter permease [Chloroflexota bacterium]
MDNLDRAGRSSAELAAGGAAQAVHRQRARWWTSTRGIERIKIGAVFLVLCALSLLYFLPIYWMISTSLKVDAQIFTNPPTWIPNPIRWSNYYDALNDAISHFPFLQDLRNTLTITVPAVTGTVVSSSIVAYSLARIKWPGRDILFGLILATMMIPQWVTLIPLYIFFVKIGWVGTFLPLTVPSWTGDAFSIFLLRQFFRQQPQEMFDAAGIDGANHFGMFWRIVLPLAKPALAVVTLFSFLNNWTDFINPLIYLSDPSMYTLMLGQYAFFGAHHTYWSELMAADVMILAPLVVLFFFTQRFFIEGVTFTGLRG